MPHKISAYWYRPPGEAERLQEFIEAVAITEAQIRWYEQRSDPEFHAASVREQEAKIGKAMRAIEELNDLFNMAPQRIVELKRKLKAHRRSLLAFTKRKQIKALLKAMQAKAQLEQG